MKSVYFCIMTTKPDYIKRKTKWYIFTIKHSINNKIIPNFTFDIHPIMLIIVQWQQSMQISI